MADSGDALANELRALAIIDAQDEALVNTSTTESNTSPLFDIDDSPIHPIETSTPIVTSKPKTPVVKKRFVGVQISDDILHNGELNKAIDRLPKNYSFEIHKTLWRIRTVGAKMVALQFPEGLLMYACSIADILEKFGGVETLIMGDVTYGACCIDDFTARALGCDFMVHYGHSCLVPINVSQMNTLYVFVDILFTINHLVHMMKQNFDTSAKIVLAGTIQFANALHAAKKSLEADFPNILIPQCKPLSQGEMLGCTSPHLPTMIAEEKKLKAKLESRANAKKAEKLGETSGDIQNALTEESTPVTNIDNTLNTPNNSCCNKSSTNTCASTSSSSSCTSTTSSSTCCSTKSTQDDASETIIFDQDTDYDICIFVADGRFHLESMMIHNPQIRAFYKYDPYNKMMTAEAYDIPTMHSVRYNAIEKARHVKKWGVALGTLGRQGSTQLMERIVGILQSKQLDYTVVLLSEIFPSKLAIFEDVEAWVQIACPRLSIDWGYAFPAPLLSTYEFDVAMGLASWLPNGVYPMDFYSHAGGAWTNYYEKRQEVKRKALLNTASRGRGLKHKMIKNTENRGEIVVE